jgi:23S rRNA pseudouridine1911/1915/1917 synthase
MTTAPSEVPAGLVLLEVAPHESGRRLDAFLCDRIEGFSRARATDHLAQGHVRFVGSTARPKASHKVARGQRIDIDVQPRPALSAAPEAIDLRIVYEDDDLLVVDKAPGMVVHPAAGHEGGTLVNALLHHAPELDGVGETFRPGLVHRIDKDTSGLLVVTKTEFAMRKLAAAFAHHRLERRYVAIVLGTVPQDTLTIETLHGRHPVDRKRFSGRVKEGKPAVTHVQVLARSALTTLVVCTLETGRSHQIRMHLSERGHPIAGDELYGGVRNHPKTPRTVPEIAWLKRIGRQALNAYALGFVHPRTNRPMRFEIGWPDDLLDPARGLFGEAMALPPLAQPVYRGNP